MSREVDLSSRAPFFPHSETASKSKVSRSQEPGMLRNDPSRTRQLKGKTSGDAKVEISEGIKDFSRIKKAVDNAPDIDNSAKIAQLKSQISKGEYKVDYDAIAERMLSRQF